jgi:hypothetical protein
MLASGDTDAVGLEGAADGRVTENVIGSGRLFDEPIYVSLECHDNQFVHKIKKFTKA